MEKMKQTIHDSEIDAKLQQLVNMIRNIDMTFALFIRFMKKEKSFKKYLTNWQEDMDKKKAKEEAKKDK